MTLTREFREDLSGEVTFEQEPRGGGGIGHRVSEGTILRLELTKQAQGTAPLQFWVGGGAGDFFPLTEGKPRL